MLKFIGKLIGGRKSEKDVRKIEPLVREINTYYEQYQSISNDELRGKTEVFRQRVKAHLKELDEEIAAKEEEAESSGLDIFKKDDIYEEVDKIKEKRDEQLEDILMEILPEAFAVMKETAHRFKENKQLTATATDLDKQLAIDNSYIHVKEGKEEGDAQVTYDNSWDAAGNEITWDMLHYDVQLIGGVVLHQGKVAEMATGEGKTLVSTLPAYLNGLTGEGVHIVTVNDYLARRDQEWNSPLLEFLGLTTDCIDKHRPHSAERRKAYLADVIYGTNNEFGFDYLRDNMVHSPDEMVQRKHHYAMVDEVDSVLIDDARTPLIISGPVPKGEEQEFVNLKPRVNKLVEAQKKVVLENLREAKKLIKEGEDDPKTGGLHLFRAFKGLPKNHALIKYMSEPGKKVFMQKAQNYYLADQEKNMPLVIDDLFFVIDEKNNTVDLTDKGIAMITAAGEDPTFFVMPDIGSDIADVENDADLDPEEKVKKKDELLQDFSIKSERIHSMQQLLKAYTLFEKDDEYVVMDGQVKIVDEQTGRVMEGRRYSDGLHQAIEAKEDVKVEAATQTFASISLQNYFRMYHKLSGMTGTASTEAGELWEIYKLDVIEIPTNLPIVRADNEDVVYKTEREKYRAVIDKIKELTSQNRPVLVGTTSVEVSELLSKMLKFEKVSHNVLNAKQHQREAQIVAEAGIPGNVTIATNMAGRGTDIKLGDGVVDAGGLAILGTARHDSRRVDLQLRGRAGRQGDPGSSQFFVSLEDDLMRMFGSEKIAGLMDRMGYKEGEVIQHRMISRSIERAQGKVEENNFGIRKRLLDYDDVMNKQRTVIYDRRRHALFGDRLALDIDNAFYDVCENLIETHQGNEDYDSFKLEVLRYLGLDVSITEEELENARIEELSDKLYREARTNYDRKIKDLAEKILPVIKRIKIDQGDRVENISIPFTDGTKGLNALANLDKLIESGQEILGNAIEKSVTLAFIDDAWKEHLRAMDDLKQSVQSAVYEQKDPLVIYKVEAFNVYKEMVLATNLEMISFLCKASIPVAENDNGQIREGHAKRTDMSKMSMQKESAAGGNEGGYSENQEPEKQEPVRVGPKVGRNDPCPCGSGKKYKHCHGKTA